jgi:hypothetical protein
MTTDTVRRRIADQAEEVEQARLRLADTIRNACPGDHRYVQHHDHEPAWCRACGYTEAGVRIAAA